MIFGFYYVKMVRVNISKLLQIIISKLNNTDMPSFLQILNTNANHIKLSFSIVYTDLHLLIVQTIWLGIS